MKWGLHALALLGLLLLLAELTGATLDDERIEFANTMHNHGVGSGAPGASEFLENFLPPNRNKEDVRRIAVFKRPSPGRTVLSGVVQIAFVDSTKVDACSFEELDTWSRETGPWKWIGWCTAFLSELLAIGLTIRGKSS